MISASYFSLSHGIATDVSSPPEYAKTIRSITAPSALCQGPLHFALADVFLQSLHERGRAFFVARNHQDRVVAADRAHRLGQLRAVDCDRERLRLSDAGADDHELLHAVDAAQVFFRGALERSQRGLWIRRFHARPLIRAVAGPLDEPELLDVERTRPLRRLEAALTEPAAEILLAVERLVIDELDDHGLATRFHRTGTGIIHRNLLIPCGCRCINIPSDAYIQPHWSGTP